MKIAIHQPQFIPWLGYFDKMKEVDLFILLDNVQFKKNEFQNRNKIKTSKGWQWLTVPARFHFGDKINEVKINNNCNWQNKHLQSIKTNYGKSPSFKNIYPYIEKLYSTTYDFLSPINYESILLIKKIMDINTHIVLASAIPNLSEEPTDRLIDICKFYKADTYLAGAGGRNYMDCARFEKNRVRVKFQKFIHPIYKQLFDKFEPYMSSLDYLFNCTESLK